MRQLIVLWSGFLTPSPTNRHFKKTRIDLWFHISKSQRISAILSGNCVIALRPNRYSFVWPHMLPWWWYHYNALKSEAHPLIIPSIGIPWFDDWALAQFIGQNRRSDDRPRRHQQSGDTYAEYAKSGLVTVLHIIFTIFFAHSALFFTYFIAYSAYSLSCSAYFIAYFAYYNGAKLSPTVVSLDRIWYHRSGPPTLKGHGGAGTLVVWAWSPR